MRGCTSYVGGFVSDENPGRARDGNLLLHGTVRSEAYTWKCPYYSTLHFSLAAACQLRLLASSLLRLAHLSRLRARRDPRRAVGVAERGLQLHHDTLG